MSDTPEVADLLETARLELEERVRPALAGEQRYVAAMIARAMRLAAREVAMGARLRERERRAIRTLPAAPDADLETLRRWLAGAIRRGDFDRLQSDLEAVLEERVAARLAITDPDYR